MAKDGEEMMTSPGILIPDFKEIPSGGVTL